VALPAHQHCDDLAEWIPSLGPTWFTAGPTYLQAVLDRVRARRGKKLEHCLRFIQCGSSYLPESARVELEAILGIPILEAYGLSEAGIIAANPMPPAKRKPGTAGVAPSDEMAIRSEGKLLGAGEIGDIVVRGPSVTPGYANGTSRPTTDFRLEWLETGDRGYIDSDGFVTIVGRTKEIINRGGEKISPYEIEKALLLHPSVAEAAAFSVPHPRLGENAAAAVVLKSGNNATPSDLKTFLYDRLAHFKVPQQVFIVSEFPRVGTGKISRSRLAADLANQPRPTVPPESMVELQIAEIWQRLIERTDIGVEDDFFEAGGNSLLAAQMLLEVEKTITGQRIPLSSLSKATTIRQLANVVMQNIPAIDELVTRAQRGTKTPFFFCHGDFLTRGFWGLRLAKLLGNDQPTFLLHPYPTSQIGVETSIETIAERYVPYLLDAQPSGAFRLGGFCNGGLLAWQIAHQLSRAGRKVKFVVLIDTFSLNARPTFQAMARMLKSSPLINSRRTGQKAGPDMRAVWNRARRVRQADPVEKRGGLQIEWNIAAHQYTEKFYPIMCNYVPPKIDTAVYCVLSDDNHNKKEFLSSAWTRLAREVHCAHIPGEHHNCITTHLGALADLVREILLASPSLLSSAQLRARSTVAF
jgi:thioesterase domain-containing protein